MTDIQAILPLIVLVTSACLLLLVDMFIPKERKAWTAILAAVGMIAAMATAIGQTGSRHEAFNGMIVIDGFAIFMMIFLLGSGLVGVGLAYDYLKKHGIQRGEYYVLLMFSITGMILMSTASDLIVVFISLELLSIPLYVLSGFAQPRVESEEASLKYFLLGAFSSSFVVYGVALIFGGTGTTSFEGVITAISLASTNLTLVVVGAGLILVGLGFKVAAVPFHMWTPDVYQGAPSPVTAFMAVGAKAGGFAALLRVFMIAFPALSADLTPVLWVLAALTMIVGNFVAIAQTNIKRLLAYSSISHAGYIMMTLVSFGQENVAADAVAAALFYLVAYALTNFGAWAVVMTLEQAENRGLNLQDYAGMGAKYPALAAAMTVFMLSFTGVPPTLGFVGKFFLFRIVLESGFVWLAIIGVLTSLISAYYYLRLVIIMYMQEGEPVVDRTPWLYVTALTAAVVTVLLSIFSTPLFSWVSQAVMQSL